jgi:hypothetical protein
LEPHLHIFLICPLDILSCFLPRPAWPTILLNLVITRMTGSHHYSQHFCTEMCSHKLFCPGWPCVVILQSVSHIARSHQSLTNSKLWHESCKVELK